MIGDKRSQKRRERKQQRRALRICGPLASPGARKSARGRVKANGPWPNQIGRPVRLGAGRAPQAVAMGGD
jgi:hypothetical protein